MNIIGSSITTALFNKSQEAAEKVNNGEAATTENEHKELQEISQSINDIQELSHNLLTMVNKN